MTPNNDSDQRNGSAMQAVQATSSNPTNQGDKAEKGTNKSIWKTFKVTGIPTIKSYITWDNFEKSQIVVYNVSNILNIIHGGALLPGIGKIMLQCQLARVLASGEGISTSTNQPIPTIEELSNTNATTLQICFKEILEERNKLLEEVKELKEKEEEAGQKVFSLNRELNKTKIKLDTVTGERDHVSAKKEADIDIAVTNVVRETAKEVGKAEIELIRAETELTKVKGETAKEKRKTAKEKRKTAEKVSNKHKEDFETLETERSQHQAYVAKVDQENINLRYEVGRLKRQLCTAHQSIASLKAKIKRLEGKTI